MKKLNEVIDGLRCCTFPAEALCDVCPYHDDCEETDGGQSVMADALEYLEDRMTTKRITRSQVIARHSDGRTELFFLYRCPHCEHILFKGFPSSINFCPKCGKAVRLD